MLFSTNLLKKYISLDIAPQDLMSTMTLHACEVEHITERKLPDLVVVWYVLSTTKHPNADTLTICQLDCGAHGQYQICTAADNIRADIFVPVALPGCYLPAIDLTIWARKMRWEDSNGMICAKVELGINEDADQHGIWIMDEDFTDLEKTDLWISLTTKYPWLDNTILDVDNKTITNRPDLTGLLGMAIEMRAIFSSLKLRHPELVEGSHSVRDSSSPLRSPQNDALTIKHQNITHILAEHTPARALELLNHATVSKQEVDIQTNKCGAYIALELSGITVRKSPFYDRLSMIDSGLTPKWNWIDFTNLFANLIGQPVHAFDADKITGPIVVRQANDGEKFIDLKGTEHTLIAQDIVIADDKGILALAGVIGWLESWVTIDTKRIIMEIAHFDPVAVRRTSVRLGVRTDAVLRFEKTLNPCLTLTAFSLMLDLLKQYQFMLGDYTVAWVNYSIGDDAWLEALHGKHIPFDIERCNWLIRWDNEDRQQLMKQLLELLWCTLSGDQVSIPRWRWPDDINISEDLYEEVARLYGYNRIEPLPTKDPVAYVPFQRGVKINRIIEHTLVHNYTVDQLQTYPWCDESFFDILWYDRTQLVQLINTTSPELSYLRPSLIPNLLIAAQKNSKVYDQFSLFDTGQTRNKSETRSRYLNKQSFETTKLWLVSYNKNVTNWKDDTLLIVKAMIEGLCDTLGLQGEIEYRQTNYPWYHPKKQWEIVYNSIVIWTLAQLHPTILESLKIDSIAQVVVTEIALEALEQIIDTQWYSFQTDGQYQTIQDQILTRDLCFVIDKQEEVGKIIDIVRHVSWVHKVEVLDLYQWEHLPKDKKSVTLTLTILWDGTWTTDQINTVLNTAIIEVEKVGGKLR